MYFFSKEQNLSKIASVITQKNIIWPNYRN